MPLLFSKRTGTSHKMKSSKSCGQLSVKTKHQRQSIRGWTSLMTKSTSWSQTTITSTFLMMTMMSQSIRLSFRQNKISKIKTGILSKSKNLEGAPWH